MITSISQPSKSSPAIAFDDETHIFKLEGISTLVNAIEFYDGIIGWVSANEILLNNSVEFRFHLPYFNSASMKGILMLMQRIKKGIDSGYSWSISWNVEDDDEFLLDAAESFEEMLEVPIHLIKS
jgi:hypothetical protein